MNNKTRMLFIAVSLSTVVACKPSTPPNDRLPASTDATGVSASAATESSTSTASPAPRNALADFSVTPGTVQMCDGRDRVVSTVTWRVKDPTVATVRIEVDSEEAPERKTFATGGNVGEAQTGEWVVAGVRFHLVDAATGKELASHVVAGEACQ